MIAVRSDVISNRLFSLSNVRDEVKSDLIRAMGFDLISGRINPEGPVGVNSRSFVINIVKDVLKYYGADVGSDDVEEMFSEVDRDTAGNLTPFLKLLPGVELLLEQLRDMIPAVIVTTDITVRAVNAMEALNIDHYFANIIGGDQVENTKPSSDLVVLACDRNGTSPKGAVVIGDHPVDIQMGSAAGVSLNIGVLTGLSNKSSFDGMSCSTVENLTRVEVQ